MSPDRLLELARRLAGKYTVAGHEPEDLEQAAFLAMWEAQQNRPAATEQWLRYQARTRLSRLCKRAGRDPVRFVEAGEPTDPGSDRRDDDGAGERVRLLLQRLRPDHRVVLQLELAGKDDDAIAAELGITAECVRQKKHRAREFLKNGDDLSQGGGEGAY